MPKTYYVYSTLANDQRYQNWIHGEGGALIHGHAVFVKGGAGVANDRLITPLGVRTQISDFDYDELKKNQDFLLHEKNGHVFVEESIADADKVAADMNRADPSAPLTEMDFNKGDDEKAPVAVSNSKRNKK